MIQFTHNRNCILIILIIVFLCHCDEIQGQTNYYVNDNSSYGDVFTTSVGDNSNSGLTIDAPKPSLTDIWTAYGPSGTDVLADGDTIFIDTGIYEETDRNLDITVGVIIQGAGINYTVFDNNNQGTGGYYFATIHSKVKLRDFKITRYGIENTFAHAIDIQPNANEVELINIQIDNCGRTTGMYPLMVGSGSSVLIDGGGVTCNNSWNMSGGIRITGATTEVTIKNYSFIGNQRNEYGTSLSVGGGLVKIYNCSFIENSLSGGTRGVVYQNSGTLEIYDCIFDNNSYNYSSAQYGATILIEGGTFHISRSKITNTTKTGSSNAYGAAICLQTEELLLLIHVFFPEMKEEEEMIFMLEEILQL
jgi:hypothetical protein